MSKKALLGAFAVGLKESASKPVVKGLRAVMAGQCWYARTSTRSVTMDIPAEPSYQVKQVGRQGPLTIFLYSDQINRPGMAVDCSGNSLFTHTLSADPAKAKEQRKCVAEAIGIQTSCH